MCVCIYVCICDSLPSLCLYSYSCGCILSFAYYCVAGNADGLGAVRVGELHRAAAALGIPDASSACASVSYYGSRASGTLSEKESMSSAAAAGGGDCGVEVLDDPQLPDGMRGPAWPPEAVRDAVLKRIKRLSPDTVR